MPSMQQWQYNKNKRKTGNSNVSAEGYADLIFKQAFEAPFNALSQGQSLKDAYDLVDVAGYLQEKVCNAWGKLEDEDLVFDSEYSKLIDDEKSKLLKDFNEKKITESAMVAKLGYFKLALILKKIVAGKGKSEELEV